MVRLEKMSKQDFNNYISNSVAEYAKEKVKAGAWAEKEAYELSKETFRKLLPNDVNTKNQYLFSIIEDNKNTKIGYMWFQYSEGLLYREAFIYDFFIFEEYRGQGFGSQSLKALDKEVTKFNVNKITLHVFSHNKRAIELYKKTGFVDTDLIMSKYI